MRTCYDVLGCSSNASPAELKSAYFRSLRNSHPDKGGADASAVTLITNAWKTLKYVLTVLPMSCIMVVLISKALLGRLKSTMA